VHKVIGRSPLVHPKEVDREWKNGADAALATRNKELQRIKRKTSRGQYESKDTEVELRASPEEKV